MKSPWWVFAVLGLAAACGPREIEPGLFVLVELEQGVSSTHVQVVALGDGLRRASGCMAVAGKPRLRVGVVQADLPATITLEANGYSDDACTTLTEPPEAAAPVEARFRKGVILEATLRLKKNRPSQETVCDNGLDDDGDGDRDCADFDCNARTCTNGNLCVTGLTCQGGQCLGGTQVVCDRPPSSCFMPGGICVVDAGCRYVANTGQGCDDANDCTSMDRCQADGACTGAVMPCTSPPGQCREAVGQCVPDAGCQYAPTPLAGCDDGDACTVGDRCDAVGGCAGTPVTCAPRECQVPSGACDADAGCRYDSLDAGTTCTGGGVCNTQGGCVPMWPYSPSNFQLTQVPTLPDAGVALDCGETIIDTSGAAPAVTNWCAGQPHFGWAVVPQSGGAEAMILSFRDLDVLAGGSLTLRGSRPAIIAAAGRVRVLGRVTAEAGTLGCAGGGRGGSPSSGNGGAGGGGFGTAGGAGGAGSLGAGTFGAGGGTTGNEALVPLRGGCAGGIGGGSGNREAAGGGALQVSATGDVIVTGAVAAPGRGGAGGGFLTGANGAGSGGAVLLEGLQVVLSGTGAVTANGGGGGRGGATLGGDDGPAGSPDTATPAPGATGGNLSGGIGGDGAAGATAATNGDASGIAAGGGGGGGAGRLRFNAALGCSIGPQTVVSPAATSNKPDAGCP